jgi:hypothetical protein
MDRALGMTTVIVSLVLLWSRVRRLEFNSLAASALTALELLGVGLAVVSLGWWGVAALGLVHLLAVLVWSVILAARVESNLVYAATRVGESSQTIKALAKRLGQRRELRALGPTERALLISLLADRARNPAEIEDIAVPVAMLQTIHGVALPWLVERFDRLLRLSGEPAGKAMEVADTLEATAHAAAATFTEIVDAFVTFYSGEDAAAA